MTSVKFEEAHIAIAENQEEYETVHAHVDKNTKTITLCFELTPEEIETIARTGKIWYQQLGIPMSPMSIHVNKPI